MHRLTPSQVKAYRETLLAKQGGKCALCQDKVDKSEAVLDHDHATGYCRGVLHRGCNSALGHVENNRARYRLTNVARLTRWLTAIPEYIHRDHSDKPLHSTYRTAEEKRLKRNAKARKTRATKKVTP